MIPVLDLKVQEVLRNNALINIHMAHTAAEMGVARWGAEE